MITVKPFKALRPNNEMVEKCAALPYDVMSSSEAREMVKDNPFSFLRVDRAEINLPQGTDIYSDIVYETAKNTLCDLEGKGVYINDSETKYYFYRQIMNGHSQTGIVGCASVDDYIENRIKKHEFTRADKELDRIRHVDTVSAHTGPIFLTYKDSATLDEIIEKQTQGTPIYDFVAEDGVRHTVWCAPSALNEQIESEFKALDALYIADGHHRCASAVKVGLKRREENKNHTGNEEYNFFLSVIFPSKALKILDYNRLLRDLNGYTAEQLLSIINEKIGKAEKVDSTEPYRPQRKHQIGIYLDNAWYSVDFYESICNAQKPVDRLDCAILQKHFLSEIMGIDDPRTDKRIDFAGGIRGLKYLEQRCYTDMQMAISMYPTSMQDLMSVADSGDVMPPKSTWFEPKLRSGILIHKI